MLSTAWPACTTVLCLSPPGGVRLWALPRGEPGDDPGRSPAPGLGSRTRLDVLNPASGARIVCEFDRVGMPIGSELMHGIAGSVEGETFLVRRTGGPRPRRKDRVVQVSGAVHLSLGYERRHAVIRAGADRTRVLWTSMSGGMLARTGEPPRKARSSACSSSTPSTSRVRCCASCPPSRPRKFPLPRHSQRPVPGAVDGDGMLDTAVHAFSTGAVLVIARPEATVPALLRADAGPLSLALKEIEKFIRLHGPFLMIPRTSPRDC